MPATHATGSWRIRLALLLGAALAAVVPAGRAMAATTAQPTWSMLSPPTSPPPLRDAAAAYDAANQTVVVFGGMLPDGALSNQTWVWNGTTWSRGDHGYGAVPAAREGASMAYDASLNQLILFGGATANGTLLDDTWLWNGASWIQVTAPTTPGARRNAAFAADPGGRLVLFGGYGVSNATTTSPPSSTTTTTTTPPSTSSTTTTSVPGTASGTSGSSGTASTVPAGSTGSAGSTAAAGRAPTSGGSGASAQRATTRSGTAGGSRSPGRSAATRRSGLPGTSGPGVLADTWLLESTPQGDDWVPVTTPVHPAASQGAAAVSTGSETLLVGGQQGTGSSAALSGVTWAWNGRTWSVLPTRSAPPARSSGVVADDRALGGVVAFSGTGVHGLLDDVWILRGDRWQRLATSPPPAARSGAVGVYDAASRQIVVFGGATTGNRAVGGTVVLAALPPVAVSSPTTTTTSTSTPTTSGTGSTTARSTPGSTASHHRTGGASASSSTTATTPAVSKVATPTHIRGGDVVTLDGGGFAPDARVVVTFEPTHRVVAVTRADASGNFRVEVTVPDGASAGRHDFRATGAGPHGPVALVTPVQVAAYTTPSHVSAATTASLVGLAVAVPVLTLLGLQLAGRTRRRTTAG